jgi:L-ascorbate metabolism protein UlaG (beta-lactamase superfamily)
MADMQLTKFSHSCIRLEVGGGVLVIDPGTLSEAAAALEGADAVLITHEHPDHIDADAVRLAVGTNPDLRVWAPSSVTSSLDDLGDRVTTIEPGASFDAAGFAVRTFGGQHALIHPQVPVVANVAYLVNGSVYHPGDSFTVPDVDIPTLLLPIHAPWSKVAEVLDFLIAVRPDRAVQIHDGLLNDRGLGMVEAHVSRIADAYGPRFSHLAPQESIDA